MNKIIQTEYLLNFKVYALRKAIHNKQWKPTNKVMCLLEGAQVYNMVKYTFNALKGALSMKSKQVFAKAILCITKYCLVCLEKCVKFLTKNAYI